VSSALELLLRSKEIVLDRAAQVLRAQRRFKSGGADFADCLIGRIADDAGCATTLTFDAGAVKSAGMPLISGVHARRTGFERRAMDVRRAGPQPLARSRTLCVRFRPGASLCSGCDDPSWQVGNGSARCNGNAGNNVGRVDCAPGVRAGIFAQGSPEQAPLSETWTRATWPKARRP
jgi:hypothetical protein